MGMILHGYKWRKINGYTWLYFTPKIQWTYFLGSTYNLGDFGFPTLHIEEKTELWPSVEFLEWKFAPMETPWV